MAVNKYSNYKFNQNQFDALVSFAYGDGNLKNLTDRGKRSIDSIANYITYFNKTVDGKFNQDLANRRQAEKRLYLTK